MRCPVRAVAIAGVCGIAPGAPIGGCALQPASNAAVTSRVFMMPKVPTFHVCFASCPRNAAGLSMIRRLGLRFRGEVAGAISDPATPSEAPRVSDADRTLRASAELR